MPLYPSRENRRSSYDARMLEKSSSAYEPNSYNSQPFRQSDDINDESQRYQQPPIISPSPSRYLEPPKVRYTRQSFDYHSYNSTSIQPEIPPPSSGNEYSRLPSKSVDMQQQPLRPIYYSNSYNPQKIQNYKKGFDDLSNEDRLLRDRYPVKFAAIHGTIMILLSLAAIALQIVMIVYQAPLYFIGSGIWSGVYFIFTAGLAILISLFSFILKLTLAFTPTRSV